MVKEYWYFGATALQFFLWSNLKFFVVVAMVVLSEELEVNKLQ